VSELSKRETEAEEVIEEEVAGAEVAEAGKCNSTQLSFISVFIKFN